MNRSTRRLAMVPAAATAVLGLALTTAPAADAYSREYRYATSDHWSNGPYWCAANHGTPRVGNATAYGCFEVDGDQLQIADASSDGKRVGLQWRTDYGRFGMCVNRDGKDFDLEGGYRFPSGDRTCRPDIREGSWITFRVGTCDADSVDCNDASNWGEWSDRVRRHNVN